jgi:hypothetical protein
LGVFSARRVSDRIDASDPVRAGFNARPAMSKIDAAEPGANPPVEGAGVPDRLALSVTEE